MGELHSGMSSSEYEKYCYEEIEDRLVICEVCGESLPYGISRDDKFGNHYHDYCNDYQCAICLKPAKRSEMVEDQDEDVCRKCYLQMKYNHSIYGDTNHEFFIHL